MGRGASRAARRSADGRLARRFAVLAVSAAAACGLWPAQSARAATLTVESSTALLSPGGGLGTLRASLRLSLSAPWDCSPKGLLFLSTTCSAGLAGPSAFVWRGGVLTGPVDGSWLFWSQATPSVRRAAPLNNADHPGWPGPLEELGGAVLWLRPALLLGLDGAQVGYELSAQRMSRVALAPWFTGDTSGLRIRSWF